MRRSDKKTESNNPNEITVSIKGAMVLAETPEEAEYWRKLREGIKCRGFVLFCAIDPPDPRAPGFTLSHKVNLAEVAGAILQDTYLGSAAIHLAQAGMLVTNPAEGKSDEAKPN
jgi:hypothetical protein